MRPIMHAMLKKAARWSALLAAPVLVGCSTIQFAYNHIDWLLIDKAEHYLDLSDAQRLRAEQLVEARMAAHRREELPEYVATLIEIRAMLADNLTPGELELIKQRIPDLYRRTMRETIPSIVALLADLDDAQVDHLQARFEERNREFADDFMPKSMQVRLDRRVERSTRMIEFFIGDLRPEQAELVRRHRNAMPLTPDDWLAYHRARQQELVDLLRRRVSSETLERFLIAWWVELAGQPPELERKMRVNTAAWSAMMLELDATLDPGQRRELLDTLDVFIEELGALLPDKAA
jgi:hypothetical protein